MNIRDMVKKNNIRLTKALGQNFLTDDSIVEKIADSAGIAKRDLIIEVGPGLGSMTHLLAERAGQVIAVEIDKRLIEPLTQSMAEYSNFSLINNDIMKIDLKNLIYEIRNNNSDIKSVKVVANLPYYITTPIIMKILEDNLEIDCCVFMVQREVADRMVAKPGGKDYGALSVAVQYRSIPQKAFDVPPHCFIPQPEVYSTVVRLDIRKSAPVAVKDEKLFFRVVKASFGQRRKTLLNALHNSGFFKPDKERLAELLTSLGIDPNRRGETLSIEQFSELSNALYNEK